MPPKSKPKGLKASKRAAPFDPSSLADSAPAPVANSTASSSSVALNKEQTMPLDEDCLTLSDLFELRQSVIEIVYPFPHSLSLDPDPERVDEARSFLRGILHGCAVLEPFVERQEYDGDDEKEEKAAEKAAEAVEKRRADAGEGKLAALGLTGDLVEGWIVSLQTFALYVLGELFEPAEESIKPAAAAIARASGGGGKRRKIDVNEPQTRLEWFAAAHERGKYLYDTLTREHYFEQGALGDGCYDRVVSYFHALYVSVSTAYARELLEDESAGKGVEEKVEEVIERLGRKENPSLEQEGMSVWGVGEQCGESAPFIDADDAVLASMRATTAWIGLVEAHPGVLGEEGEAIEELDEVAKGNKADTDILNEHEEADDQLAEADVDRVPYWTLLAQIVAADALQAKFILLEDEVEAKFRPDAGDEDEEDEEAEVTPLPMDAVEVRRAKAASEEGALSFLSLLFFRSSHPSFYHSHRRRPSYHRGSC
jgi:hypothetical protein